MKKALPGLPYFIEMLLSGSPPLINALISSSVMSVEALLKIYSLSSFVQQNSGDALNSRGL